MRAKRLYHGWVRVQPASSAKLPAMAEALGFDPAALKPTDKSLVAELTPMKARNWRSAMFLAERAVRNQIERVTGEEPAALTIHVELASIANPGEFLAKVKRALDAG